MNEPSFDSNGYVGLSQPEILENLKESVFNASALGPEASTGTHTILGMHLEANSIEMSFLYDILDDLNAAWDSDSAEGVQQDNLNRLRGAIRKEARKSTSIVSCGGDNGTTIAVNSIVSIGASGERWLTNEEIEIAGGSTDVAVTAENTGAIEAAVSAINTIVTTTTGWNTVENAAAAEEGEPVETDPDYRLASEDTSTGTTTEDAVYTRLRALDTVDAVVVTSNRDATTDSDGTPGHTMWVVVYPNTVDPQLIADTIWAEAGAAGGIGFRGDESETSTDVQGNEQLIKWDWADAADVWISVVGTKDGDYPDGGDDLVEDAITAYFATVRVGADVNPLPIESACSVAVPGITILEARMKIGSAPGPGDTSPLTIAIDEYAELNATIGVTIT